MVQQRSITFVDGYWKPAITTTELDLDNCFKDDEIVIKVKCCAINPIDMVVYGLSTTWLTGCKPKTFGRDFSGVIVRAGSRVDPQWKVDDEVNGQYVHLLGDRGSFSDYLIFNPAKNKSIAHMQKFPRGEGALNYNEGKYDDWVLNASFPLVYGTADSVLADYIKKWTPESRILVIGASTQVSNCLIQIAKRHYNIGTVVGICNKNSFEYNEKFGWDHLVSYNDGKTIENVTKLMEEKLGGEKFDMIFDSVGNTDFFPVIDKFLKPKSTGSYFLTVVGDNKLDYKNPTFRRAMPLSVAWKKINPFLGFNYSTVLVKPIDRYMKLSTEMIQKNQFEPVIDSVYEFDQYQEAMDKLLTNKAKGKIVIRVNK